MNMDNVIAERSNKIIYRDGDKCIKLFAPGYSKADILNEALNHARVEELGVKVPALHEVTTIGGQWALVYEYISGKTLAQLMEEEPEKRDEYLEQFVDLQISLHTHTCMRLNRLKDKMNQKIIDSALDADTRYELHGRLEGMPRHNKLCHGDFNPTNIIISDDGTPYVLDWSHVTRGNASADAARTYLLFCLADDRETGEKYLHMFCEKTKTDRRYVNKWMPIVAASQSVKGNAEERDLLLSWASVVEW